MPGTKKSGRPGGNPEITKYSFKTDRKHPLTELLAFRVDKPTKEKIKSGIISDWQKIAREAVERAILEAETQEKQAQQDFKSA